MLRDNANKDATVDSQRQKIIIFTYLKTSHFNPSLHV